MQKLVDKVENIYLPIWLELASLENPKLEHPPAPYGIIVVPKEQELLYDTWEKALTMHYDLGAEWLCIAGCHAAVLEGVWATIQGQAPDEGRKDVMTIIERTWEEAVSSLLLLGVGHKKPLVAGLILTDDVSLYNKLLRTDVEKIIDLN